MYIREGWDLLTAHIKMVRGIGVLSIIVIKFLQMIVFCALRLQNMPVLVENCLHLTADYVPIPVECKVGRICFAPPPFPAIISARLL